MGHFAEMSLCGKIRGCWAHWVAFSFFCASSDIFNPSFMKSICLIIEGRGAEGGRETVKQDQQDTSGHKGGIIIVPSNYSEVIVIFMTQEGRISRERAKVPVGVALTFNPWDI